MLLRYITFALLLFFGNFSLQAQFLSSKKNLTFFEGYFNFHYSETEGALYLEVPKDRLDTEFLYVHSIRTGLGSNDIGLDRGQLGGQAVVKFVKTGNKILLVQPNLNFRAITENEQERKSVAEAFARSVLFGFEIKETTISNYIIDISSFLMEDAHQVTERLKKQKEGAYKLDLSRSSIWMERTKAFPKNSEFEALLTFTGTPTGRNVPSIAPSANALSLIQHYSFVELPEEGYTPRKFDPRSGSFSIDYLDYSTPIWEPIKKQFITRHRLLKKDPLATVSEPVKPIIYYLDPGTPEPVKTALLEGAKWWNEAFEAIGFKNAFQVTMLPENADPMDVRYNVIQWVHRSTRGWSYGGSVIDPRTGEIIKGHVSLGSLRIRQDFMIAQALMNKPFAQRDDNYQPMLDMALARIRQLSAHEVGHTLGFAHNFAASTNNDASVMDYPHPHIKLTNGQPDFTKAYATGIGAWDKITVAYSYGTPGVNEDEARYLNTVLEIAKNQGLQFISDPDARPQSGAHSKAHLWDNGNDAAETLNKVLALRSVAINNFSIDNIRKGDAYSTLEDVFVPLYFYHRFQTEAAVKMIGGMEYNYAVKGDGQLVHKTLARQDQERALSILLKTIAPSQLAIPEDKLALFPPRAYGFNRNRESFKSDTGVAFDALGAAATASEMTLSLLLNPVRANRIVQQKALDNTQLGLSDVLQTTKNIVFNENVTNSYEAQIKNIVQFIYVQQLMNMVVHKNSTPQTSAIARQMLLKIADNIDRSKDVFDKYLNSQIAQFMKEPEKFTPLNVPQIPDGSPIGSSCTTTFLK